MGKQVLGRGLGALIPQKKEDSVGEKGNIMEIPLSDVIAGRYQPRKDFNEFTMEELKQSIAEKGVLQPIIVRKKDDKYELIAGERRFRAAKSLGMEKIPAIIKEVGEEEAIELSLIENIQREDLNPVEEANAYKIILEEYNMTQEELANRVGKDRVTITNSLRLLHLPEEVLVLLEDGKISVGHAKVLLSIPEEETQIKLAERIEKEGLSVRALEKIIQDMKEAPVYKRHKPYKDPHITSIEDTMQQIFGTKVTITQGKKKGKIEIEFYTNEDLERILDVLGVHM